MMLLPVLFVGQVSAPAPGITFPVTHIDFGRIPADHKVSCRYTLTNSGQGDLKITRVHAACGCTYTLLGKWTLAPGEMTGVEVTFDPAGLRGRVQKALTVRSNDPAHPNVILTFEADVIWEIAPEPSALLFEDIPRSGSRSALLRLKSGNGHPVQVKEIRAVDAPYLSAVSHVEGNDAVLDVSLDGRKIPQDKRAGVDALTVQTTSERTPVITIPVRWERKPVVIANPARVGWVEAAGKDLSALVTLKHTEGKPFRVLGGKATLPSLRVEGLTDGRSAQQEVRIVLASTANPGTYDESVVLLLDDPDQPELVLRVVAVLQSIPDGPP